MVQPVVSYLSLGSNLGHKENYLAQARSRIGATPGIKLLRESPLYRTRPVGNTDQDWFLNQVVEIETTATATTLLAACQQIEIELGRVRHERWGPRTLDIDILLYGDAKSSDPVLTLPHPRMLERAFVLVPLADLSPNLVVAGQRIKEHMAALPDTELAGVQRYAADASYQG